MFVKNCWYVAAWTDEVGAEDLFSRTILNTPVLFWRDSEHIVRAMIDRCCHRLAPLSLGKKVNDCIQCNYHGLIFDKNGQCISAPAQTRLPKMSVQTFPVVEKNQWIWIWMGDENLADPNLIPDIFWYDHPDWAYKPNGHMHYPVNYLLIADNLLDFSHLPFLHPTTLGGSPDYASVLPKVTRNDDGLRLEKMVNNTEAPGYSKQHAGYDENTKVDRWMYYDFLIPSILLMDAGMYPTGTGSYEEKPANAISFKSAQALTPETEHSTHYFFGQARDFALDDHAVSDAIYNGIIQAFNEDKEMILGQQRNIMLNPSHPMKALSVDSALSQFRWLIDKKIKAEQVETTQQIYTENIV
ncbi:vanillate O-demethylase monooxygenase subunit [Acinetobacter marinus]|uniref:Vanillate O-demethylase monooxygenase subunit n=1 Tax=Acinetobacter marinus TaxID=281375 RepID=A0A1G6NVQ7_9GAMM|nr:aromatic ring-hydroxylating dioxygenase subunit alpha [Acinetobacter marinus]SDC71434.1 vanillate O-demethylase monooxygenase subunit [Acinetobacter marinus]